MSLSDLIDQYTDEYVAAVAAGEIEGEAIGNTGAGDLGWGSDLAGWQDIEPEATERSGDDPMVVVEAMLRRITTARGSLPDDDSADTAEYGIDVTEFLNRGSTPRQIEALGGVLENEISKDDRIAAIQATVTSSGSQLTIDLVGEIAAPDSNRPFSATLAVTSADVLIKAISV